MSNKSIELFIDDNQNAVEMEIPDIEKVRLSDVLSVNGKTGVVVLKVSDLENDKEYTVKTYVDDLVQAEATARANADTQLAESIASLLTQIQTVASNLQTEVTNRQNADTSLNNAIGAEVTNRQNADTELQESIEAEETARENADSTLNTAITNEANARGNKDTELEEAITEEAEARENADEELEQAISNEQTARNNADNALQQSINAEALARQQADNLLQPKENGKGLSTNDYTNDDKELVENAVQKETGKRLMANAEGEKLANIEAGAEVNIVNGIKRNTTPLVPDENGIVTITVPTQASDINALPNTTKYGSSLVLSMNTTTYVLTAQLKDQDGNILGTEQTIDFPLEEMIVSGEYDATTKKIVLTLRSGDTIEIPVADIVSGLVTEQALATTLQSYYTKTQADNKFVEKETGKTLITTEEKQAISDNSNARHTHSNKTVLDGISAQDITNWNAKADTDDIPTELSELNGDSSHRTVTDTEKNTWNGKQDAISDLSTIRENAQDGKEASDTIATYGDIVTHNADEFGTYSKPTGGIPKSDLAQAVKDSLDLADGSEQEDDTETFTQADIDELWEEE